MEDAYEVKDFIKAHRPAFSSDKKFKSGVENIVKELMEYAESNKNQLEFYGKVLQTL